MSPPGVLKPPVRQHGSTDGGFTSAGVLAREISALFQVLGLEVSGSRISRLARRFAALPSSEWEAEWARVIAYADPTGETAVYNVMRG